ncbi:hypothetical protein ABAC460_00200 [Asticcacaulis sp. AC460]|nr:hypothetical protein ABAC460_00200 [Asticcacaulis sp. AC460]
MQSKTITMGTTDQNPLTNMSAELYLRAIPTPVNEREVQDSKFIQETIILMMNPPMNAP